MASDPYHFPLEVEKSDIDFMGHVNNATYLKWVQAAVVDHWRHLAPPEAIDAYAWVAVKHEITYRKPAFLDDPLVAIVQLEQVRRESAFYETAITRGGELLAEARSRWCCLDAETLRPVRLPGHVIDRFVGQGG
jgi:acyl-CoA thioester hydrolase